VSPKCSYPCTGTVHACLMASTCSPSHARKYRAARFGTWSQPCRLQLLSLLNQCSRLINIIALGSIRHYKGITAARCCHTIMMSSANISLDNNLVMPLMQLSPTKAPEQPEAILAALPPLKRRRTSQPPKRQEEYKAVSPAGAAGRPLIAHRALHSILSSWQIVTRSLIHFSYQAAHSA